MSGMADIKINNAHKYHLDIWEDNQSQINDLQFRQLKLNYKMNTGRLSFNQLQSIIILGGCCIFAANSNLSLGVLMSISYVLGQLTGPVNSLQDFRFQDTERKNLGRPPLASCSARKTNRNPTIRPASYRHSATSAWKTYVSNIRQFLSIYSQGLFPVDSSNRQDNGNRRQQRLRQNHSDKAAAGILQTTGRKYLHRQFKPAIHKHQFLEEYLRSRSAERMHIQRHYCRKHRARHRH